MMVPTLGAWAENVGFLKTGITDLMDFIFVQYLLLNNGQLSDIPFHFQGRIVKVSSVWGSIYNILNWLLFHNI